MPAPLRRAAAASRRREPGGDPNGSAPLGLQGEGPGRPPIRAAGFPSPLIRHKRFNYLFCHAQLQPQSILRLPLSAWQARGASPGSRGCGVCVWCVCRGGSPLPAPRHNPQKVAARRKSRILPEPRPPGWRAAVAKGHQREGGAPGALLPLPRRLAPRAGAPGASLPARSSPAGVERRGWRQPYERRGLGGGSPPSLSPSLSTM